MNALLANTLPFFTLLDIWGRFFIISFLGLAVPTAITFFIIKTLLFNLEPFARFVAFIVLVVLTFCLNTLSVASSNAIIIEYFNESGIISFLLNRGPWVYKSLLLLFWILLILFAVFYRIQERYSQSSKPIYWKILIFVSVMFLFIDWQITTWQRSIAPENEQPKAAHSIIIVLPHVSRITLEAILATPELFSWQQQTRLIADVIPASEFELSQIVSFLSEQQPWQHGVRTNQIPLGEEYIVKDLLSKNNMSLKFSLTRALGHSTSLAKIINTSIVDVCNDSLRTQYITQNIFLIFPFFAQLPTKVIDLIIPEYRCTLHLSPLSDLVNQELIKVTSLFKIPQTVNTLWWMPSLKSKYIDESLQSLMFSDALVEFVTFLKKLNLDKATRIFLIGLGDNKNGSLAVIGNKELFPKISATTKRLVVGTVQAANLITHGVIADKELVYSEFLGKAFPESHPVNTATLEFNVFYSSRELYCSFNNNSALNTLKATATITNNARVIKLQNYTDVEVLYPKFLTQEECKDFFMKSFLSIENSDVSITNKSYYQMLNSQMEVVTP